MANTNTHRLCLTTLAALAGVWGCGRDSATEPDSGRDARPALEIASAELLPPTLTGEDLLGSGRFVQRGNCQTDDQVTIFYFVRGIASVPYAGTFAESGRVVVAPAANSLLEFTGFEAAFVIWSPAGLVSGRKSFSGWKGIPQCDAQGHVFFPPPVGGLPDRVFATYTATIRTRVGSFRDEGSSTVFFVGTSQSLELHETFESALQQTVPISGDD